MAPFKPTDLRETHGDLLGEVRLPCPNEECKFEAVVRGADVLCLGRGRHADDEGDDAAPHAMLWTRDSVCRLAEAKRAERSSLVIKGLDVLDGSGERLFRLAPGLTSQGGAHSLVQRLVCPECDAAWGEHSYYVERAETREVTVDRELLFVEAAPAASVEWLNEHAAGAAPAHMSRLSYRAVFDEKRPCESVGAPCGCGSTDRARASALVRQSFAIRAEPSGRTAASVWFSLLDRTIDGQKPSDWCINAQNYLYHAANFKDDLTRERGTFKRVLPELAEPSERVQAIDAASKKADQERKECNEKVHLREGLASIKAFARNATVNDKRAVAEELRRRIALDDDAFEDEFGFRPRPVDKRRMPLAVLLLDQERSGTFADAWTDTFNGRLSWTEFDEVLFTAVECGRADEACEVTRRALGDFLPWRAPLSFVRGLDREQERGSGTMTVDLHIPSKVLGWCAVALLAHALTDGTAGMRVEQGQPLNIVYGRGEGTLRGNVLDFLAELRPASSSLCKAARAARRYDDSSPASLRVAKATYDPDDVWPAFERWAGAVDTGSSSEEDTGNASGQPCDTFFREGECPHRNGCRYSHTPEAMEKLRRCKTETCHAFRDTGRCKFGDRCRYSHAYDVQPQRSDAGSWRSKE